MSGPDYAQMLMLLKTLERRVYEYALSRSEKGQLRLESAVREAREKLTAFVCAKSDH